jgi:hypothetical protein
MAGLLGKLADKYLPEGLQAMLGFSSQEISNASNKALPYARKAPELTAQEPQKQLSEQEKYNLDKEQRRIKQWAEAEARLENADKPSEPFSVGNPKEQEISETRLTVAGNRQEAARASAEQGAVNPKSEAGTQNSHVFKAKGDEGLQKFNRQFQRKMVVKARPEAKLVAAMQPKEGTSQQKAEKS